MANDDDILTTPVPGPEAEASPSERAHARTFAELIDKTQAGKTPAAMSTDDRALVEVATVIRATHGALELTAARRSSIVEEALARALNGTGASASVTSGPIIPISAGDAGDAGGARARARRRWVPWTLAGASTLIAAAAVLLLWLRAAPVTPVARAERVPASWTSRPADPLIGPIARAQAGDASARIDYIFADRLDGFRERRLSQPARAPHGHGGKP